MGTDCGFHLEMGRGGDNNRMNIKFKMVSGEMGIKLAIESQFRSKDGKTVKTVYCFISENQAQ